MGQQEPHPTISWALVLEEAREEDEGRQWEGRMELSAEGRGVSGPLAPGGGSPGGTAQEAVPEKPLHVALLLCRPALGRGPDGVASPIS